MLDLSVMNEEEDEFEPIPSPRRLRQLPKKNYNEDPFLRHLTKETPHQKKMILSDHEDEEDEIEDDDDDDDDDDDIEILTLSGKEVKKKTTKEVSSLLEEEVLKPAPCRTIRGYDAIFDFLASRIKDQVSALCNITAKIDTALTLKESMDGENKPLLYNMLLTGTSGCGKTETVNIIRHLLGMDPGYEYQHAFVEIDGSVMTQESQVNCLTGAAAGLVGYKDGNTLADQLNYAINPLYKPDLAEPQNLQEETTPITKKKNKKSAKNAKNTKKAKETTTVIAVPEPPPVIMLFIDEVDKVCYEFLKAINGLLDKGSYRTPSGVSFVLPKKTAMLIVFTSNYGAEEIAAMRLPYDEEAERYARNHMRACGLQPYTIARMGDIFPYYPLKGETLKALLTEKLEQYLAKSSVAKGLTASHNVQYGEDFKELLVNYVHQKVDEDHGVRGAIRQLFQKLDLLFSKALTILKRMIDEAASNDEIDALRRESLHLTGHTFNIQQFSDEVEHEWSPIIDSIRQNPANTQTLVKWCEQPLAEAGILKAMGVRLGATNLCHFVLPVNLNVILQDDEKTRTKLAESEQRAQKLRDVVVKVDKIVNAEDVDAKTAIKQIRKLTRKEPELLLDWQDSEDDVEEEPRVRMLANEEAEEEERPKKRKNHEVERPRKKPRQSPSSENDESEEQEKIGQPKKWQRRQTIPGFTYERYHNRKKKYSCNQCGKTNIDSRYIDNHHCDDTK